MFADVAVITNIQAWVAHEKRVASRLSFLHRLSQCVSKESAQSLDAHNYVVEQELAVLDNLDVALVDKDLGPMVTVLKKLGGVSLLQSRCVLIDAYYCKWRNTHS